MMILILGGTSWLGGEVARVALTRGHTVTCLARGESGRAPANATFVRADRGEDTAYQRVCNQHWDGVVDVSWQPGFVRGAVTALAARTRTWVYVSSCSVYAAHDTIGADESAELLPALDGNAATLDAYGEAKVSCERAVRDGSGSDRAVIARAGLIGGPGDHSDRSGYWPMRFAHPATDDGAVLVPDCPDLATQVIDVRDLATWLVHCIEQSLHGTFNACGPLTRFADHLDAARRVASHTGPLVTVPDQWLTEHEVNPWAGPRSLPLWLPDREQAGIGGRNTDAARAAGLVCRPLEQTLADVLDWEVTRAGGRQQGARKAGLSPADERLLIEAGGIRRGQGGEGCRQAPFNSD
jgi:nucleoside-diphosphate-sugar epimerase